MNFGGTETEQIEQNKTGAIYPGENAEKLRDKMDRNKCQHSRWNICFRKWISGTWGQQKVLRCEHKEESEVKTEEK